MYWNYYKCDQFYYLPMEKRTTEVDAICLNKCAKNTTSTANGNEMLALRKSHLYFPYLILWQYIFAATVNAINVH